MGISRWSLRLKAMVFLMTELLNSSPLPVYSWSLGAYLSMSVSLDQLGDRGAPLSGFFVSLDLLWYCSLCKKLQKFAFSYALCTMAEVF